MFDGLQFLVSVALLIGFFVIVSRIGNIEKLLYRPNTCPYCKEGVKKQIRICPHCQSKFEKHSSDCKHENERGWFREKCGETLDYSGR